MPVAMPVTQYVFSVTASNVTWTQSEAMAQSLGGHLASMATADEEAFAKSVLASHSALFNGNFGPWIGLHQDSGSVEPGGGWKWIDGSTFDYTDWAFGQPDNNSGDSYGLFYRAGAVGWGDDVNDSSTVGSPVTSLVTELAVDRSVLRGTAGSDFIYGGAVDNVLRGNDGNDWLYGAGGQNTLIGGGGHDHFAFTNAADANGDVIQDLYAKDIVDLSGIDADVRAAKSGDQSFYLVDAFDGRARELVVHFNGTTTEISGDTDADGQANFTITANGDLTGFQHFVY